MYRESLLNHRDQILMSKKLATIDTTVPIDLDLESLAFQTPDPLLLKQIYRELELSKKDLSDDEIISLMMKHPDLMQRPIVERGDRAVLGRPTENVKALLR